MNTLYRVAKSCSLLSFYDYFFIIGETDFNMFISGLGKQIAFSDMIALDAFDKLCREYGVKFESTGEYGTYSGVIE